MSRRPATIEAKIKCAVKAVVAAGVEVACVEVDKDERIIVIAGRPSDGGVATLTADDELQQWRRKRKRDAGQA
jgi:hypothetical protein